MVGRVKDTGTTPLFELASNPLNATRSRDDHNDGSPTNRPIIAPIITASPSGQPISLPPAPTSAGATPPMPGSAARRRWDEYEDSKRPTSPHITSAMPVRHSLSGRPGVRIPSPPPHRQSSLGRTAATTIDIGQDEEAGKGHGLPLRTQTASPFRTSSASGWRRAIEEAQGSSDAAHDGRRTPAAYRPTKRSSMIAQARPYIQTIEDASPLQRPQARRGAVRLSRARRRRKPRTPPPSMLAKLRNVCLGIVSVVRDPIGAVAAARQGFHARVEATDAAFRDANGRRTLRPEWIGAYIPLIIWLVVSLSSTVTVLIWHTQVFKGLDHMATTLQGLGMEGRLILGCLIFVTTFPPLPLYSTLIVLCGFAFGMVQGFIISYIAALSGALCVFLLSRTFLRGWMVGLLNKSGGLKKVVRAIEKRPHLLFTIRLAPYPYNLMNTLLASSPTLSLQTYTVCTALALPKLLVHTGLGATIKNFAAYNGASGKVPGEDGAAVPAEGDGGVPAGSSDASASAETVKHVAGFVGVALCIGVFLYLYNVASAAVDELDSDDEDAEAYDGLLTDEEDDAVQSDHDSDIDAQPLDSSSRPMQQREGAALPVQWSTSPGAHASPYPPEHHPLDSSIGLMEAHAKELEEAEEWKPDEAAMRAMRDRANRRSGIGYEEMVHGT